MNFASSGQKVITSDEEAQAIKVSNPQIDWTQALDQFIHDQAQFSGEGFVPMQTKF
ncbi:MAG: hypothetical protein HWD61_15555 [Parachlamydiaceae bacterium]|nr:MAG: hypothetical protein HWD61_15555 [Parachlamydiaceae bacterium]